VIAVCERCCRHCHRECDDERDETFLHVLPSPW
jgi:hypothetical protein